MPPGYIHRHKVHRSCDTHYDERPWVFYAGQYLLTHSQMAAITKTSLLRRLTHNEAENKRNMASLISDVFRPRLWRSFCQLLGDFGGFWEVFPMSFFWADDILIARLIVASRDRRSERNDGVQDSTHGRTRGWTKFCQICWFLSLFTPNVTSQNRLIYEELNMWPSWWHVTRAGGHIESVPKEVYIETN